MKTHHKILVVDDDPVIGKTFERVLSSKGYAIINCSTGAEALEKLKKEEYDAVFTDLRMPGMDGIEVATKIKETQPWMPVVIVTGYGTAAYEKQAADIGITEFMHKPLSPEMIEDSADNAMLAKEAINHSIDTIVEEVSEPIVEEKQRSALFNVALFLAAPFIGLLYALFMPIVGVGTLLYFAASAAWKVEKVRIIAKIISAPFIGLAFVLGLPFFGLGALYMAIFK